MKKSSLSKGVGNFKLTSTSLKKYENVNKNWDSFIKNSVPVLKVKDGRNQFRIMPPTWDDADHFGYDLHIHYVEIAGSRNQYLCHRNMKYGTKIDPICEEQRKAEAAGDKDYASSLKSKFRLAVYVIDRDTPEQGPQLWLMPKSVNDQIVDQAVDDISGEILQLHDIEDGYDIVVTKKGAGLNTDYSAKVARASSSLNKDVSVAEKWIEYIIENPIPDCLEFKSYDYIHGIFHGTEEQNREEDDSEVEIKSSKNSEDENENEPPWSGGDTKEEEEEDEGNEEEEGFDALRDKLRSLKNKS